MRDTMLPDTSAGRSDLHGRSGGLFRFRTVALLCSLASVTFLIGAVSIVDAPTNYSDLAKAGGVFAFVCAMVMLALGMVGNAYKS